MDQYNVFPNNTKAAFKQVLLIVGVMAILLAVAMALFKVSKPKPKANNPVDFTITDADHVLGSRQAKIVLLEYSDFQCPACKAIWPQVEQLHQDFGDSLLIVYRHYPLPQHKNSQSASEASEAAGKQGKFFEMAKTLLDNQTEWADSTDPKPLLIQYAQGLGLNLDKFIVDMASDETYLTIQNNLAGGNNAQVGYTPSFFLNGKLINNPTTYDAFHALISDAIPK